MAANSQIEENYLKAIFMLSRTAEKAVSTSAIAEELGVQSASVTDMIKKLSAKKMVSYKKYYGVELTKAGSLEAVRIIRNHRLWEVFLAEKLGFGWGDVHEIAEQLEHVRNDELTDKLDAFLGYPQYDPHGDPIPDSSGGFRQRETLLMKDLEVGDKGLIIGVKDDSKAFLEYLDNNSLVLKKKILVEEKLSFDLSMKIRVDDKSIYVSEKTSANILVSQVS